MHDESTNGALFPDPAALTLPPTHTVDLTTLVDPSNGEP
jgi:hypothetical protein